MQKCFKDDKKIGPSFDEIKNLKNESIDRSYQKTPSFYLIQYRLLDRMFSRKVYKNMIVSSLLFCNTKKEKR